MAVNWALANQGGGFDYLESLQALGGLRAQRQQLDANDFALRTKQQVQAARPQIAQRVASGDYAGARSAAAAVGDFDYADVIGKLDEGRRKQLERESEAQGSVAWQLRQLPPEARAQALAGALPALRAAGFADTEWTDLGDQALDGKIAVASNIKDVFDRQLGTARLAETQRHNLVTESRPRWQFDSESGSWLQEPGTGNSYAGPSAVPQAGYMAKGGDPASGGGTFARMIGAESGGRQFAANGQPLTSSAGAVGIAQVMPGTAPEAARLAGLEWDRNRYRTDPEYNAALGQAYFAKQQQTFGDEAQAVAAYNAGPGRVKAAIRKHGDNWLANMPAETQAYVGKVLGGQGAPQGGQPGVVNVRAPKRKDAPSGYQWQGDRLAPIPGGPADPAVAGGRNPSANRKAEADLRKQFDSLDAVKKFSTTRSNYNTLRNLALKKDATPQDDIAIVFNFMKTLDPTSVVREGEFATAQNAGGVDDATRNLYNRVVNGNRLNRQQRLQMAQTALTNYVSMREAYNTEATKYRGYAQDYGINPDRVAKRYVVDGGKKQPQGSALRAGQSRRVGNITIKALN